LDLAPARDRLGATHRVDLAAVSAPGPLFSSSWYRVAGLRPQLVGHARIHRHRYRDEIWYVLQDRASDRHHRFSPAAYLLIGLMNGERTVQELWDAACARLGDETPTQDDVIQLLAQLHAADALSAMSRRTPPSCSSGTRSRSGGGCSGRVA
jgi:hypothetical protein